MNGLVAEIKGGRMKIFGMSLFRLSGLLAGIGVVVTLLLGVTRAKMKSHVLFAVLTLLFAIIHYLGTRGLY